MLLRKLLIGIVTLVFLMSGLPAEDKNWEIEVHYSSWSLNFLSSTIIGILEDEIDVLSRNQFPDSRIYEILQFRERLPFDIDLSDERHIETVIFLKLYGVLLSIRY